MPEYTVTLTATTCRDYRVEADSIEEAKEKAHKACENDLYCSSQWSEDAEVETIQLEGDS
jgi:metal-sulfur cluster biosynthetic enzyme